VIAVAGCDSGIGADFALFLFAKSVTIPLAQILRFFAK